MTIPSVVDAQSVLAVDVGSINTRAFLFDVVDGQYHFLAAASIPTTINTPYSDANEGVVHALLRLQEITGRPLLDQNSLLIVPPDENGAGIDRLAVTASAGPDLRVAIAGLLADVSLESARRLASSCGQVVESLGLNDTRRPEAQLDALLHAHPDLVIIAGGTENGATRSVLKLVDLVAMACRLLPQERRPQVLYVGNQALHKRVRETLEKFTGVHIAANVRPGIDIEDMRPAEEALAEVVAGIRTRQVGGLQSLSNLAGQPVLSTSHAFGRVIRFLSQANSAERGVLGIDLGASTTTVAMASGGKLSLSVLHPFGMGAGAFQALQQGRLDEIIQWLPLHVNEEAVRDAVWNKPLFPATLPLTSESLAIEQALARQLLRLAMQQAAARWPGVAFQYEQVLATGAALTQAATPGQALLMLLDGLQPSGITTFLLDQNNLFPALGAIAGFNTLLPVQVIETGALLNLATVIAPLSAARYGTPILNGVLEYEDGNASRFQVKQGALMNLPIRPGQTARVTLEPLRRVIIDPARKNLRTFKITGGVCGAIIDARGRPLILPDDDSRRRDLLKKWSLVIA